MSNNFRSRGRLPFNFIDGVAIKGVDITPLMDFNKETGSALIGHNDGTVKDALDSLSGNIGQAQDDIEITRQLVRTAVESLFPVGTTYTNATVDTNPATLLGFGTWASLGAGRVLVGVNPNDPTFQTSGLAGGSKDAVVVNHTHVASSGGQSVNHTHTGSTNSTGDHIHKILNTNTQGNFGAWSGTSLAKQNNTGGTENYNLNGTNATATVGDTSTNGTHSHSVTTDGVSSDHNHAISIETTGVSATNANLQPYLTVYIWVRVS